MTTLEILKELNKNYELMAEMDTLLKELEPTNFYEEVSEDYRVLRQRNGELVAAYRELRQK